MVESYENSKRSRHIDIKIHFIKDIVSKQLMKIQYVSSNKNIAHIFTKALCQVKFITFRYKMNVM